MVSSARLQLGSAGILQCALCQGCLELFFCCLMTLLAALGVEAGVSTQGRGSNYNTAYEHATHLESILLAIAVN